MKGGNIILLHTLSLFHIILWNPSLLISTIVSGKSSSPVCPTQPRYWGPFFTREGEHWMAKQGNFQTENQYFETHYPCCLVWKTIQMNGFGKPILQELGHPLMRTLEWLKGKHWIHITCGYFGWLLCPGGMDWKQQQLQGRSVSQKQVLLSIRIMAIF